ncbi:D-alanyl-D-alanine carboxypeptidase/D-alanyl-D-alanine-endopeptidase [Fodinibacter luteus]|uniref:D-alanyl-D-alanine carboxypeptidase/D-alanyl-D-alanine-endopeptidase n=2 Tax=Fodinibacter luteus TaxID=552064 RepID=A0ABP8KR93_9MICO
MLASAGVLLAVSTYAAADVLDAAPGILTLDRPVPVPTPTVSGSPAPVVLPEPAVVDPVLADTGSDAPVPTAAGLERALTAASGDPALDGGVGISVRDGITGEELWALDADRPRVPASTAKLLAALAVVDGVDLGATMATRVVAPAGSTDLVLVASGDTLLAPGTGDPDAVAGRAGLADLAAEVADALAPSGARTATLRLDLSWAPGPRYPSTWNPNDVRDGFTQAVVMTGLATQLPAAGRPSPRFPEREVARVFAEALSDRGIRATLAPERTWTEPAPAGALELGSVESATYADVLDLALDRSENALTENLVRQAAATAGRPTTGQGDNADFIVERLTAHDVPTEGLVLKDASGLSPDQAASAATLSGVLRLAAVEASGQLPELRGVLAGLPVGGLSGTLRRRFTADATQDVAGVPRAKTGTLRAGSALAGTTVSADGRPLTYVVLVDEFPETFGGTQRARAALDRIVAALTRCGCR